MDAEEALRVGLVQAIARPRARQGARDGAGCSASKSPVALRAAKDLVNRAFGGDHATNLEGEAGWFGELFSSEDAKEGLTAFVEKREPNFSGR